MNGLCGWLGHAATLETQQTRLTRMAGHIGPAAPASFCVGTRGGLTVCGTDTPLHFFRAIDSGVCAAFFGHPRWHSNAPDAIRSTARIAEGFVRAFRDHGTQSLTWLSGDFALALLDERAQEILLAIDRTGIRTLAYHSDARGVAFSTHLGALRDFDGLTLSLDHQALYDYIYFHIIPAPATIYQNIQRLLPGQYLHWRAGQTTLANYALSDYSERPRVSFEQDKERLFELLRNAVRNSLSSPSVGCFLSGGLDSSTVVGITGEVTGAPAHSFSIGFAVEGYDEMEYARTAARHFSARHEAYYVTPEDVRNAVPRVAAYYDNPYGNASAVPLYYCAKLARDQGVALLLGGDGGDELFGGNARYAKQWQLSLYHHLPGMLRRGILEPLIGTAPTADGAGLANKVRSYIRQANLPPYERMEGYNLLHLIGAQTLLTPGFLSKVSTAHPLQHLQALYAGTHGRDSITRMMAMDMQLTLADNDLVKVGGMCELAGIDVAYPFLDDELCAFAYGLPLSMKLRRTQLRHFYKHALRGFLPDVVIDKEKHGFGLPFGVWMQSDAGLRELTCDSLNSLKSRDIVSGAFIDELINTHIPRHPGYYGTLAWVLMMLEHWFETHHA